MPPSTSRASRTKPAAPSGVETSATIGTEAATDPRRGFVDRLRPAAAERDLHAFVGERLRHREAEPFRRRGDRGALPEDSEIHDWLLLVSEWGRRRRGATRPGGRCARR